MSAAPSAEDALARAWTLLREQRPPAEALALVPDIQSGEPHFGRAQHLRGLCALRLGDPTEARGLLVDAMRHGELTGGLVLSLAEAVAGSGPTDEALQAMLAALGRLDPKQMFPFMQQLTRALGLAKTQPAAGRDAIFEKLLLPLLAQLLARRDMDNALRLEILIFEDYVKATETEAHFGAAMAKISPLFTEAGHAWRAELPPLPQPALTPPYRIGFFIHAASMLAHIEILLNTLKGYRRLDDQPFEPTVYCFSGKDTAMEAALAAIGVRLVMLNERFPEAIDSSWQRLLRLRELLSEEGVQELVWISRVTIMPLAFAMRIAPVQTWFAMKYRNFSHPDIDGYVSGSALTRYGTLSGRRWRMAMLGVDDWYDATVEARAADIRAQLGGAVVLMTLARTEKMRDPAYLGALVALLQAHPKAVFLWAGRDEDPLVVAAFREGGVLDRTRFIGWVNTRLFAQVADVFLDTFPFPCGFTLFQAMAAGKPVVIYDSPEAAQTGLWNFLKPLLEDGEGTAEERAELEGFVGDAANPLIPVARTPEEYARLAGRFIDDLEARAAGGRAARGFMERYFSDPRVMGSSLARHFVELIEDRRTAAT